MFLFLLFATFAAALVVSFAVMLLFTKPIDSVLRRIIADEINAAWSKYMKFAILVVGVSAGVQLRDLEKYINPTLGGREVPTASPGFGLTTVQSQDRRGKQPAEKTYRLAVKLRSSGNSSRQRRNGKARGHP